MELIKTLVGENFEYLSSPKSIRLGVESLLIKSSAKLSLNNL